MNRRQSIEIVLIIAVAVAMVVIGFIVAKGPLQERAIREAYEYRRDRNNAGGGCSTVMSPAVHFPSGAKLTFTDGCLPPGWSRVN